MDSNTGIDGMNLIAESLGEVANALHRLGMANASTHLGALEALSMSIEKAGREIAEALDRISGSIEAAGPDRNTSD